ncbi:hypothetical protein RIR_v02004224500 [Rhizophagus irregularis DAOM 181602=DAOM 197198]|nr:hypothetical protein RIR_v02004224500 [Rhizophagus irregularis DAOM 181602=DAOM 197198]
MIYSTPILWDMLDNNDRKILGHFVRACNLLVARFITEDDLREAQERLKDMAHLIERTYEPEFITSNIHLALHIPDCCRDYGSIYSFWLFPYERLNGYIEQNEILGFMDLVIDQHARLQIGAEIFGSMISGHQEKNVTILAKWKASNDDSVDIYPGDVQYYFEHTLRLPEGPRKHLLAYVKWYKSAPSSDIRFKHRFIELEISNTKLWQAEYFQEGNPDGHPIHSPNNYDIRFFNELSDEFWLQTSYAECTCSREWIDRSIGIGNDAGVIPEAVAAAATAIGEGEKEIEEEEIGIKVNTN